MTSTNNKVDTDSAEAPDKGVGCGALVRRWWTVECRFAIADKWYQWGSDFPSVEGARYAIENLVAPKRVAKTARIVRNEITRTVEEMPNK
jgi:hypothetical protein